MTIRLSAVLGDTATASLDFGGDGTLDVTYRPGAVTPASLARVRALLGADDTTPSAQIEAVGVLVSFLSDVLVSWNLLNEDDTPIGVDAETLAALPVELLARVFAAINGGDAGLGEAPAS